MECYVLFTPLFGLPLSIWFDFIVMHLDLYTYILSHLIKKEKCKASMTPTKQEEEWKKKRGNFKENCKLKKEWTF